MFSLLLCWILHVNSVLLRQRKTSTTSRNLMRSRALSQCRSWGSGVTGSYFCRGKSSVSELHFFLNITTVIDNIVIKSSDGNCTAKSMYYLHSRSVNWHWSSDTELFPPSSIYQTSCGIEHRLKLVKHVRGNTSKRGAAVVQSRQYQWRHERQQDWLAHWTFIAADLSVVPQSSWRQSPRRGSSWTHLRQCRCPDLGCNVQASLHQTQRGKDYHIGTTPVFTE